MTWLLFKILAWFEKGPQPTDSVVQKLTKQNDKPAVDIYGRIRDIRIHLQQRMRMMKLLDTRATNTKVKKTQKKPNSHFAKPVRMASLSMMPDHYLRR